MKSHGSHVSIESKKNQNNMETTMGRKHLTLKRHCRGSHFTWGERLRLQYHWNGSNGHRNEISNAALAMLLQKSPKTIARELRRGMVEHLKSSLEKMMEYNAFYCLQANT